MDILAYKVANIQLKPRNRLATRITFQSRLTSSVYIQDSVVQLARTDDLVLFHFLLHAVYELLSLCYVIIAFVFISVYCLTIFVFYLLILFPVIFYGLSRYLSDQNIG